MSSSTLATARGRKIVLGAWVLAREARLAGGFATALASVFLVGVFLAAGLAVVISVAEASFFGAFLAADFLVVAFLGEAEVVFVAMGTS